MDLPLVISYYTKDTPYEQEVQRLISSCQTFSIEAQIEPRPSLGSWEKNCAQKASFILQKLREVKRPVLWVDADAVFLRAPDFREFDDCDFSVRINEFLPKDHESRIGWALFHNFNLFIDCENSKIAFCDSLDTLRKQGYPVDFFTETRLLLDRNFIEFEAVTEDGPIRYYWHFLDVFCEQICYRTSLENDELRT
jgi:hypothetical protein